MISEVINVMKYYLQKGKMMKTPLISIIIPAYNAESTIKRAIDSISQNDGIEIIVAENGSTDSTYELVKSMAEQDKRIKLIQSEKGVSNARNAGLKNASGKWVSFLDADDSFCEDAFDVINRYVDYENDLIVFGHKHGQKSVPVSTEEEIFLKDDLEKVQVRMLKNPTAYMLASAKLFLLDIIRNNNISFDKTMVVSEDSEFVIKYMLKCDSIVLSESLMFNYTVDNVSTMRKYNPDRVKNYLYALNKTSKNLKDASISVRSAFGSYVLQNMNIMMVHGPFDVGNPEPFLTKVRTLKNVSKVKIIKESMRQTKLKDLKNLRMLPIFLVKYRLYILAAMIYRIRAYQNSRHIVN